MGRAPPLEQVPLEQVPLAVSGLAGPCGRREILINSGEIRGEQQKGLRGRRD